MTSWTRASGTTILPAEIDHLVDPHPGKDRARQREDGDDQEDLDQEKDESRAAARLQAEREKYDRQQDAAPTIISMSMVSREMPAGGRCIR